MTVPSRVHDNLVRPQPASDGRAHLVVRWLQTASRRKAFRHILHDQKRRYGYRPVSRSIIERHGGRLWTEQRFRTRPARDAHDAAGKENVGSALVSVVDDDDSVREALPELSMSSAGSRRRQMIYETKFVPREPTQPTLLSGLARG